MTYLTRSFTYKEMMCPCGKCNGGAMDPYFMECLQLLRDKVGVPLLINSGFRCLTHNSDINGAPDSMHLLGRAADIHIHRGSEPSEIPFAILVNAHESGLYGVGVGETIIHVDNRTKPTMWFYTDR